MRSHLFWQSLPAVGRVYVGLGSPGFLQTRLLELCKIFRHST